MQDVLYMSTIQDMQFSEKKINQKKNKGYTKHKLSITYSNSLFFNSRLNLPVHESLQWLLSQCLSCQ